VVCLSNHINTSSPIRNEYDALDRYLRLGILAIAILQKDEERSLKWAIAAIFDRSSPIPNLKFWQKYFFQKTDIKKPELRQAGSNLITRSSRNNS
jgi:hypothetical protein